MPTFGDYAARWQKEHVDVNCKPSSAVTAGEGRAGHSHASC
jgi:hypothetical protein